MMRRTRRLSTRELAWLGVSLVLLMLGIQVALNVRSISFAMSRWTGEEDLREQVKGTAALVYLRLTHPAPRTDPLVPIRHTGLSPYGVNTFLEQEVEAEKVDRSLQLVAQAGFHWIRQQFPWEDIEIAGKGDYRDPKWGVNTWDKYDRIVASAEKHGLEIIARLDAPPAWSRKMGSAPGWTMAPPDDLNDYGDFVHAVVSRYKGRIRYYQIWNEPNIYPEWGDQPADPLGFVKLLQVAYSRAKEADPDCVIICAGLAQTTEETPEEFKPRNMSDLLYLDKMYLAGAKGYFDIMGAQVYGLFTGPYDRRLSRDRSNYSRVQLLREIMVRHGDADKPIWATEVGWNALPDDFAGPAMYGRVSESYQALYAAQAYERAAREWPWMGVMNYWFLRRPSDAEVGQAWYYFRMLEPDFAPLPVYDTLASLAQQPPRAYTGYHQEDHWALQYHGPWKSLSDGRAVLGGYREGAEGAMVSWAFQGTHLALVLREPEQIDRLHVILDGRREAPCDGCPVPASASGAQVIARGLDPEVFHQVQMAVQDGVVGLDGFVVWSEQPRTWIAIVIGLGVAGVVYAVAARRRRRRLERKGAQDVSL
jgi:hypothetical protein